MQKLRFGVLKFYAVKGLDYYNRIETRSGHSGYAGQTGHNLCGLTVGQVRIIKISRFDPDSALTALLGYFDLLAQALKVQSCYLFFNV